MNIILLSGGSGKRLWPLSNDIRSKQFIKFFKDDNALLKYIIEKCIEDEFVLRLYEERLEVRLEE